MNTLKKPDHFQALFLASNTSQQKNVINPTG